MSTINWGIIGLGNIANKFASAFSNLKNSKLLSVASKNIQNIEKFQRKFNLDNNYCYNNSSNRLVNKILRPTQLNYD